MDLIHVVYVDVNVANVEHIQKILNYIRKLNQKTNYG